MNAEPRAASRRGVVFRGNTRSVEDDDARVDGRTDDNHHASTSGRRRGRRRETCHTSSITRGSTEFARTRPRGPVGVAALPSLAYFSLYSSSNQFFHSRTNARSLAFNLRVRRVRINPFHRYHNARQLWKSAQSSPPPAFDAGGSSNVAHPPPASSAGGGRRRRRRRRHAHARRRRRRAHPRARGRRPYHPSDPVFDVRREPPRRRREHRDRRARRRRRDRRGRRGRRRAPPRLSSRAVRVRRASTTR